MGGAASSVLQWAKANETKEKRQSWRLRALMQGERDGTVRHPFKTVDRDDYLSKVKGRGIVAKVNDAPITTVDLDKLTGIQRTVNQERLQQHLEDEDVHPEGTRSPSAGMLIDVPVVVKHKGEMYLHDGHHRATAAWVRGERAIGARVVDLDGEDATARDKLRRK